MIPTLQLDPSTLALWFNVDLLGSYRGEERGLELFTHAANHDMNKVYPILDNAESDAHRAHYYEMLSAVWHEKRHFVDFLLTSFGAFQVRTYFSMYFNLPEGLKEFRNKEIPVLLPLDTYADPVKLIGLENKAPPSNELLKLAKWLRIRKRALREDSTPYDGGRGLTDFSGVAQMEAIAYSCQLAVLKYALGTDAIELLNNHSPLPTTQSRRYAWARDFWIRMPPHPEFPPSADIVNMDVMMALMVASLCGKMFTLPDEPSVPFERTQPSWRFLKLFTSERWAKYAGAEAGELWRLVDAKAKELWGFTIEEELLQDWETEGRLVAEFRARHSDAPVVRAFEKYHSARKRVIDDFIASPTNYTSTAGYWKTVNEGISPIQVISSPKGCLWSSPAEPLFDYDFSHLGSHPILRGWHAVVNPNAADDGESKIKLGFDDDWRAILTEFSPVTKLLVSGRAQRVMVGAELAKGEALLTKTGFKFRSVPPYEIYEERVNGEEFRHLSGLDQAPCDFTGKLIMARDFDFISPWEIRSDKAFRGFLTYIAERMESEQMAALTLAKDWSYWLTSKEHAQELRQRFGLPL